MSALFHFFQKCLLVLIPLGIRFICYFTFFSSVASTSVLIWYLIILFSIKNNREIEVRTPWNITSDELGYVYIPVVHVLGFQKVLFSLYINSMQGIENFKQLKTYENDSVYQINSYIIQSLFMAFYIWIYKRFSTKEGRQGKLFKHSPL